MLLPRKKKIDPLTKIDGPLKCLQSHQTTKDVVLIFSIKDHKTIWSHETLADYKTHQQQEHCAYRFFNEQLFPMKHGAISRANSQKGHCHQL